MLSGLACHVYACIHGPWLDCRDCLGAIAVTLWYQFSGLANRVAKDVTMITAYTIHNNQDNVFMDVAVQL